MPKTLATNMEEKVSSIVAGIRLEISSMTGRLVRIDVPMFPVKTSRRYRKY